MKTKIDVGRIESDLLLVDFEENFKVKIGTIALNSDEARVMITKALKKCLAEQDLGEIVRRAIEDSILSTVRGYFTHGEGRLEINRVVEKTVVESPLMKSIKSL